ITYTLAGAPPASMPGTLAARLAAGQPRQVRAPRALGVRQLPSAEGLDQRRLRAVGMQAGSQPHRRRGALLARQQVEHSAPEQDRVADAGWEAGRRALVQPAGHGGPDVRRLAGEVLPGALREPC